MSTNIKTAIVMEVNGSRAVVLTKDGQFRRMRLNHSAKVGDVVSTGGISLRANRLRFRSAVAGAAAAAVIVAGILHAVLVSPPQAQAYAFVSLDISPSISLDLSDKMTVIGVRGTNPAGVKLARSLHVTGKPLNFAISQIVQEVSKKGLLSSNQTIVVAAASGNNDKEVSTIQSIATEDVNQALRQSVANQADRAKVYSLGIPESVWEQALKANVSPGIYATYLLANEAGLPVPLADINSSNFQTVLGQVHDLESGASHLDTGNYNDVATLVQSQAN